MTKPKKIQIFPTFNKAFDNSVPSDEAYVKYRQKWTDYPTRYYVGDFPINVDFEISSHCNLKCVFCMRNIRRWKDGFMDIKLFKRIIDEGVKHKDFHSIKLNYRGEATMHKHICDFIRYASGKVEDIMLNTNGNYPQALTYEMMEAGLTEIAFSVDALKPGTYKKLRVGGEFDMVCDNILNAIRVREHYGFNTRIRASFVRQDVNFEEFEDFVKVWEKLGVDKVTYADCYSPGSEMDKRSIVELVQPNVFRCCQLWQRLVVLWDGTVIPCCGDFNQTMEVGNANEESLTDIWHGPKMKSLRIIHTRGDFRSLPTCKSCAMTFCEKKKKVVDDK